MHCRMALEVFLGSQRVHSRLAGRGAEIIQFDGQVCMRWYLIQLIGSERSGNGSGSLGDGG